MEYQPVSYTHLDVYKRQYKELLSQQMELSGYVLMEKTKFAIQTKKEMNQEILI